jgi:hypothetical protein
MTTQALPYTQQEHAEWVASRDECLQGRPRRFMENYLKLRDHDGQLAPLKLKLNQEYYNAETFEGLQDYFQGMDRLVLKHRDALSTTFWHGAAYAFSCCVPGFVCASIIDSEQKHKTVIIPMMDTFHANMPEWIVPVRGKWDTEVREYLFNLEGGGSLPSTFTFSSARTQNFARGGRPKMVIQSEKAYYEPTFEEELDQGIEGSTTESTWKIYESTPKGTAGGFYAHFKAIQDGQIQGRVLTRYWFQHPDNILRSDSTEIRPVDRSELVNGGLLILTDEEKYLQTLFPDDGIPPQDRLLWRRWRIARATAASYGDEGRGRAYFLQEYPENSVDCWSNVPNPALPRDTLAQMERNCRNPINQGDDIPFPGIKMQVWEKPSSGRSYVGGLDPARGVTGGDMLAFQIIDAQSGNHVLQMFGHVNVTQFVRVACEQMAAYNQGLFAIEATGNGWAAVEAAKNLGYGNLYSRKTGHNSPLIRRLVAKMTPQPSIKLGWETTSRSRPRMHEAIWNGFYSGRYRTFSSDLVRDLLEYNPDENHIPDRVAAWMIAVMVCEEKGSVVQSQGRANGKPQVIEPIPYL